MLFSTRLFVGLLTSSFCCSVSADTSPPMQEVERRLDPQMTMYVATVVGGALATAGGLYALHKSQRCPEDSIDSFDCVFHTAKWGTIGVLLASGGLVALLGGGSGINERHEQNNSRRPAADPHEWRQFEPTAPVHKEGEVVPSVGNPAEGDHDFRLLLTPTSGGINAAVNVSF